MFALWIEEEGLFQFSLENNGGVEISEKDHGALFAQHPIAMVIVPDADGRPALAPESRRPLSREDIDALRLRAYADPVTGSDRHFAKVVRLQAMGGSPADIESARTAGTERYEEIKAEYPYPSSGR